MGLRRQRSAPAPPQQETTAPQPPHLQELLDPQERPTREDLSADRNVFDSLLEPVPQPRWLRGRRRAQRDRLS